MSAGNALDALFTVESLVGREALSELFEFRVDTSISALGLTAIQSAAQIDGPELTPRNLGEQITNALVGQLARFEFGGVEQAARYGLVYRVAYLDDALKHDAEPERLHRFRFWLRPRASILLHRKNSRIFQGKYFHEIVRDLLEEAGIPHRWILEKTYTRRIYCTQYEETDWEFILRLFAEEGVYCYFDHGTPALEALIQAPAQSDTSTYDQVVKYSRYVAMGVGILAGIVGENAGGTTIGLIGNAGEMTDDMLALPGQDPEDPAPATGGSGFWPTSAAPRDLFDKIGEDVLVFSDVLGGYAAAVTGDTDTNAPMLALTPPWGSSADGTPVWDFGPKRATRPNAVEIRDYNFRRPLDLPKARADAKGDHVAVPPIDPPLKQPLSVYEHRSDYKSPAKPDLAEQHLDQYRRDAQVFCGKSLCTRLFAGGTFSVNGERFVATELHHEYLNANAPHVPAATDQHEALYRAVAAAVREIQVGGELGEDEIKQLLDRHETRGPLPRGYGNRFEAAPAEGNARTVRPPRPDKSVRRAVSETAIVVGPAGTELHVDRFGRIKVQFHWDRHGKFRDGSSCWIRPLQTWAGTGYGFQFIPRVGMEVLVTFIGGDPDRPVVAGCLYNATHPLPEQLPMRQTRSGIRTQSTPAGNGFNELSFDDAAGTERLYMHAQKDLHVVVNDGHTTTVKGKQEIVVSANQETTIRGDCIVGVSNKTYQSVGGSQTTHVGGPSFSRVTSDAQTLVQGDLVHSVVQNRLDQTSGNAQEVVHGCRTATIHGDSIEQIGGGSTSQGNANHVLFVQGNSFYTAGKIALKAMKPDDSTDGTSISLSVGDSHILVTADEIVLKSKKISLSASDNIHIGGAAVSIGGSDKVEVKGKDTTAKLNSDGAEISGGSKVVLSNTANDGLTLDGGTATLAAASTAKVMGSAVKLVSGSGSGAGPSPGSSSSSSNQDSGSKNFKIKLTHGQSLTKDMGSVTYRLVTDGGFVHQASASQGNVEVQIPDDTKYVQLTVYANELDNFKRRYRQPLNYTIRVFTDFPAASTVTGARLRLRNLGWRTGTSEIADTMDAITTRSLKQLQHLSSLSESGELDSDTQSALEDKAGL
ncbi:MAG: type VI secretion system tip protein TssI/VgrG [Polyangiaceae bacterium]